MTDERSDRGDGRDAKGRWTKDTSGNPSGRPPDVPDLNMADVYNFSQVPAEIVIGGEKQLMTRQEIVLLKLFESALKGRITAQKYLIEEMTQGYIRMSLDQWIERMDDDPSSISMDIWHVMRAALESLEPRRSKIRTRRGGKRKRK